MKLSFEPWVIIIRSWDYWKELQLQPFSHWNVGFDINWMRRNLKEVFSYLAS